MPYLAVTDTKDSLFPLSGGIWNEAGRRQTEALKGNAQAYYLWAWRNTRPNEPIKSITIDPRGPKFLIAGITLGNLEEFPFPRTARREVEIVLAGSEAAGSVSELEVSVDRGVATYPLPVASSSEFLSDDFKGWGEAQNESASPAYVEVAATPSATLAVKAAGEPLGSVNWKELEEAGKWANERLELEILDRGKNWVHVMVLDDDTGKPVPCRIHFRSPDGVPYQPHGFHNHVNSNLNTWHVDIGGDLRLGQITYAYIDGKCQGWLPRGEVIVDAARGFEYEPLPKKVTIAPGQRELTVRLKRWTNLRDQRWFSGDSHVHFLATQGAHREAEGEDLQVVNLLQSQWGHLFTNTEDFTGQAHLSEQGDSIVYCSQENRQHFLGHLILWGLKEPVMPWASGGPPTAELGGTLDETMSHWADACHRQGGTVVIPHLPNPNGEPAALIATGRADAVEMLRHESFNHLEYYRYLNCGYRLPLVGGTDKMSSDVPVGLYRTYAHVPDTEAFNYESWCRAVRVGRTFLSGGPIISLTVDGAEIGDTLRLSAPGTVEVEASAESIFPIHTLEIVQEGRVVASTGETRGARRLHLRAKITINGHSWLAARCAGPDYTALPHHDGWNRGLFAHTSPIYLAVGGDWWMFDRKAAQYMLTLVSGSLDFVRHKAALRVDELTTHHHGEDNHMAYLERPLVEAIEAIHRRMHQFGIPH